MPKPKQTNPGKKRQSVVSQTGTVITLGSVGTKYGAEMEIELDPNPDFSSVKLRTGIKYTKFQRNQMSIDRRGILDDKMTNRILAPKSLLSELSQSDKDPNILANATLLSQKLQMLRDAAQAYDMLTVFRIVTPVNVYISGALTNERYDLFRDFLHLTAQQVGLSNAWYKTHPMDKLFEQDLELTSTLLQRNCTEMFWQQIQTDATPFPEEYSGGPLMFYLALRRLQNPSEAAIDHLLASLRTLKISKFDGENVDEVVKTLRATYTTLMNASIGGRNFVPSDFPKTVIEILQTSSVPKFNEDFADMEKKCRQDSYETGGRPIYPPIDRLLNAACMRYRDLVAIDKWNVPTAAKKQSSFLVLLAKGKIVCDNCGKEGHIKPECTEPINEEVCKKNREARMKYYKEHPRHTEGGRGGRGRGGRGRGGRNPGRGRGGPRRQDPATRINTTTGVHEMQNKDGKWVKDNKFYNCQTQILVAAANELLQQQQDNQSVMSGITLGTQPSAAGTSVSTNLTSITPQRPTMFVTQGAQPVVPPPPASTYTMDPQLLARMQGAMTAINPRGPTS